MKRAFNRSISLPMNPNPKARATFHVRSLSLPPQSHPLVSNLEEQIQTVRSWAAKSDGSLSWIEAGLTQIEHLHSAVNDFLQLSETKTVLQRGTATTEHLLDNLLYLVDSYGSLLSTVVTLKQQLFEVQSALRRSDSNFLMSSLKSQRRTEKELTQILSSLRAPNKISPFELASNSTELEIIRVLKEAICATSTASVVIYNRVVSVSTIASTAVISSITSSKTALFAKKASKEETGMMAFEKLIELEKCVDTVMRGTEKVFRSLIKSRVSLLNIQSDLF